MEDNDGFYAGTQAREAEKWSALYEALKGIDATDGKMKTARVLMKKANPKMKQNNTLIQLLALEHLGYIEGLRGAVGKVMEPMAVKIMEKGHEYFRRRIEGTGEPEAAED